MVQRAGIRDVSLSDEKVVFNDAAAPVALTSGLFWFYHHAYRTLSQQVGERATRHSIRHGFVPLVHAIECAWCHHLVSLLDDKSFVGRPRQVCGRSSCTEKRKRAGYRDRTGRYARLTQPEKNLLPSTTGHSLSRSPIAGFSIERSQVPDRWGWGTENEEARKRINALESGDRAFAAWFTKPAVAKWREDDFDPAVFDEWDYPTWAIEAVRTACENAYLTGREREAIRKREAQEAQRKASKRMAQKKSETKLKLYKDAWIRL
jgi:hypothetical protein